jgi:hypothetical protein
MLYGPHGEPIEEPARESRVLFDRSGDSEMTSLSQPSAKRAPLQREDPPDRDAEEKALWHEALIWLARRYGTRPRYCPREGRMHARGCKCGTCYDKDEMGDLVALGRLSARQLAKLDEYLDEPLERGMSAGAIFARLIQP